MIATIEEFDCATLSYTGRKVDALRSGKFVAHERDHSTIEYERTTLPEWAFNTLVNSGFYR